MSFLLSAVRLACSTAYFPVSGLLACVTTWPHMTIASPGRRTQLEIQDIDHEKFDWYAWGQKNVFLFLFFFTRPHSESKTIQGVTFLATSEKKKKRSLSEEHKLDEGLFD